MKLAEDAYTLQNKNAMDEALREIIDLCRDAAKNETAKVAIAKKVEASE